MNLLYDPGIVLYLPLYELDGSPFESHDPYGHLSTVTGASYTARGRSFDGIDDDINCGNSGVFDFNSAFTLAAWVKLGALGKTQFIICNRDPANKAGWALFYYSSNKFYLQGGDGATWPCLNVVSGNVYSDTNTFYFLVATFDDTGRLFVNGAPDGTDTSAPLAASDYPTLVGNDTYVPSPFEGVIGEVYAFSRALSHPEILHIYQATKWRYR
ncbi:MAG: LamG domain-containing protein [Dehalococcoidales bacterium]|nr:LamG domain-containing protein [Dehalococcoidales bacterium]